MRQKILSVANSIYAYIKSPLGLTIAGGVAVSTTTYFFERTKIMQELMHAEDRLLKLASENSALLEQNRNLVSINQAHSFKSDELRDEIRHVKEYSNDCYRKKEACESSLRNTWFFCKNAASSNQNHQMDEVALKSKNNRGLS